MSSSPPAAWVQWHGPGAPDRAIRYGRARYNSRTRTRARGLTAGLTLRADVDVRLPIHEPTQRTRLALTYCGDYRSCAFTLVAHGLAGFIVDHPRHATRLGSGPKAVREPPADALSGVELGICKAHGRPRSISPTHGGKRPKHPRRLSVATRDKGQPGALAFTRDSPCCRFHAKGTLWQVPR